MTPQEQRSITEVDRIRDQFRRAFEGEAWHGPAVLADFPSLARTVMPKGLL